MTYYDKLPDNEKNDIAMSYFFIGHDGEDGEEPDKHFCWMWNGNDVIYKRGGNHPCNFGDVANKNFKGWYDTTKNVISIVFPEYELRKLSGRKPTEDDIPTNLYRKLISKFGKRKPTFIVFENKMIKKSQLKQIIKEIARCILKEKLVEMNHSAPAKVSKHWWMDPNLVAHEVPFEKHREWGVNYLKRMGHNIDPDKSDVYGMMYRYGFIHITKVMYGGDDVLHYSHSKHTPLNHRQLAAIKDLAIEEGCKYISDTNTGREEELQENSNNVISKSWKAWWMEPSGILHEVYKNSLTYGHSNWAVAYCRKYGLDVDQATYILRKKGWIRLTYSYFNDKALHFDYLTPDRPNEKQMSEIKSLAVELGASKIVDDVTGKDLGILQENMTYDQLLKLTADTPKSPDNNTSRIDRSKNVRVRSIPVSVEEGSEQWNFRYRSDRLTGNPGEPLQGHITFLKGEVASNDQAADLECKVDCSCPDYKYKFAHNNFKQGASDIGPKSLNKAINRSPKPAYDIGEGLCKHLSALSGYLQTKIGQTQKSNLFEAVRDVARQGPFNITYND